MKLTKNTTGENFINGVIIIMASIMLFMFAFISEGNKITGYSIASIDSDKITTNLIEFNDINSLSTLSVGNYYIDSDGIVYYLDDNLKLAIAKVIFVDEVNKNRHIYIDNEGRIGYVLEGWRG